MRYYSKLVELSSTLDRRCDKLAVMTGRTSTTYSSPSASSFRSPRCRLGTYGGANGSNFLPSSPSIARRSSVFASKCGVGSGGLFCRAGHRRISHYSRPPISSEVANTVHGRD